MEQARILVDGNRLLQQWTRLAPGKPRQSEAAREELINRLTQYFDAEGTPITIVFDGDDGPEDIGAAVSTPEVEILFTARGQTAHQLLERLAHRQSRHGQFQVVTDDLAGRSRIESLGGAILSCDQFMHAVETILNDLEHEIERLNQREQEKFSHH